MTKRKWTSACLAVCALFSLAAPQANAETLNSKTIYNRLAVPPSASVLKEAKTKQLTKTTISRDYSILKRLPPVHIRSINFAFNSDHIGGTERIKLRPLAGAILQFLHKNPYEVFFLEGHTDAVGSPHYNLQLSQQRADAVRRTLITHFGVPSAVLIAQGFGEDHLLVPTAGPSRANRRVTIRRITPVLNR